MVYLWRSEDNLRELILSFHYVGSRNQTQVTGQGSKSLYPQSHFTDPRKSFLKVAVRCLFIPRDMFSKGRGPQWHESRRTGDEPRPSHDCSSFTTIAKGKLSWTEANNKVALRKLDMCFQKYIFPPTILNKTWGTTESQNYST